MNKKLFTLLSGVAIITSASLQSCADEFDPAIVTKQDAVANEYAQNFIKKFGEPAENHNWGLSSLKPLYPESGASTRSANGEGDVDVQRNMWCMRETNGNYKNDATLIHTIKVPGWPNDDGYYYTSGGEGALQHRLTKSQIFSNDYISQQPIGDVTDYEIQYVSWWFRTHRNPISIDLHLSDFFIQNVSCDNDQKTYTGAVEGNAPLTFDYNNRRNGENAEYASDASSMQYENITQTSGNERLNYSMEKLDFYDLYGNWTHVNNFNHQNSNFDPEYNLSNNFREIKYITSSGTEDFQCLSSMASKQIGGTDSYVLVKLEWDEPMPMGSANKVHREGYYLAFDFSCETNDTRIDRDGFYSNWIIKITPGHFVESDKTRRVMCEDLGNTHDFDFDDVVFDIAYDNRNGKNDAIITLQAAGGTMPIQVGIKPGSAGPNFEAHAMLGESSTATPVNVIASAASHPVATYRVPVDGTMIKADGTLDITKIKIYVNNEDVPSCVDLTHGENSNYNNGQKGNLKVPMRFGVPTTVQWMQETKQIDDGYGDFSLWATNEGHEDPTTHAKWYQNVSKKEIVYKYKEKSANATSESDLAGWEKIKPAGILEDHASLFSFTDKNFRMLNALQIATYNPEGQNSIINTFATKGASRITNTIAFTSNSKENVPEVLLLPIWVKNGKLYYMKTEITETTIANAAYTKAVYQESIADETKTFVAKFGFTKDQISYIDTKDTETTTDDEVKYCDYFVLFVKGDSAGNITIKRSNDETYPYEWFVQY